MWHSLDLVQLFKFNNVTLVLVFLFTFVVVFWSTKRPKGVPPGPPCWPFIGNIGSLVGGDVLTNLHGLRKKYGDVYGVYIGSDLNVFLNGYDVIHDAFVKKGRVFSHRATILTPVEPVIVFATGEVWKIRKDFLLKVINDLFLTNRGQHLSNIISEELACLTGIIDNTNGQAINPLPHLYKYFASIMYRICFGRHVEPNDARFLSYLDSLNKAFARFTRMEIKMKLFPFLKYFPGDLLEIKAIANEHAQLITCFAEWTRPNRERLETMEDGTPTCLTDMLWASSCDYDTDLKWKILHELMAAGTETSATTSVWFLLFMAMYPSWQEILYEDVKQVIGKSGYVVLAERENLPSIEAAILETFRLCTPVPLSVIHTTSEDVTFSGYFIPKGTNIHPNLSSAHFDEDIFPDPATFNPDRFLSEDKKTVVNTHRVVPFSIGRRSCLGESVARAELFMTVVGLLRRYKVSPSGTLPSTTGVFGLTYRPQPFEVVFTKRMDE